MSRLRIPHLAWWAMASFLLSRLVSGIMIAAASADQEPFLMWTGTDPGYLDMTVLWDGSWYGEIAENGYPAVLPLTQDGQVAQNAWAFYPLFPMTARVVMSLSGASFQLVGSTLALIAGVAAAGVIAILLARRVADGVALAAVIVWGAAPPSPTFQIAYTESFAVLLLALYLLAVQDRRWWAAAGLAPLIGLTRPIAAPLGVVLLTALVARWRARGQDPLRTGEVWGAVTALGVTALSAIEWPIIAGLVTGVGDAYSQTMGAWRAGHEIVPVKPWLTITQWTLDRWALPQGLTWPLLIGVPLGLLLLVLGPWARALGTPLRAWCLAYPAYLVLVLDPFTSLFRYLLPLFPLAVIFVGGGRVGRVSGWLMSRTMWWTGVGLLGQVVWIWQLLRFVPPTDYPP
ncbi:MAG: hypothetical protein ACK5MP_13960 [Nostocoides sp.]